MQIVQPLGFGKVVKVNQDDRKPQDYSLFLSSLGSASCAILLFPVSIVLLCLGF